MCDEYDSYVGCPACDLGYIELGTYEECTTFDVQCVVCGFQVNVYTMAFSWEYWDSAWFDGKREGVDYSPFE